MSAADDRPLLAGQRPSRLNASGLIVERRSTTRCGQTAFSEADIDVSPR